MDSEARDHDVVPDRGVLVGVGFGGSETASSGLEEQGGDIAGDEDAGVGFWCDAGVLWAKG